MPTPGQNYGQPTWGVYLGGLIAEHGSLVAVSERLAATHGWRDDVESITRALRRLRQRGSLPGGKWGDRLLRTFGLPASVDARLRFMGSYHSRFVDLPVPLCADLVQLWDRPPTNESRAGRLWLSLARRSENSFLMMLLSSKGNWLNFSSITSPFLTTPADSSWWR